MKSLILTGTLIITSSLSVLGADAAANWTTHCMQCHGKDGHADTKIGKMLNAKDLTDAKVQASFTDAEAATAIKEGIKDNGKMKMKAFGDKLSADEIKALVAYVRTLKK